MAPNLTNPFPDADKTTCVMANMDATQFNYFWRGVFAGVKGPRQAIINLLFTALYNECKRENIPNFWEPENEQRVAIILSRINFRPDAPVAIGSGPTSGPKRSRSAKPRTGTGSQHDAGAPPSVRPGDSQTGTVAGNV